LLFKVQSFHCKYIYIYTEISHEIRYVNDQLKTNNTEISLLFIIRVDVANGLVTGSRYFQIIKQMDALLTAAKLP
jgi:hypothetical protein